MLIAHVERYLALRQALGFKLREYEIVDRVFRPIGPFDFRQRRLLRRRHAYRENPSQPNVSHILFPS